MEESAEEEERAWRVSRREEHAGSSAREEMPRVQRRVLRRVPRAGRAGSSARARYRAQETTHNSGSGFLKRPPPPVAALLFRLNRCLGTGQDHGSIRGPAQRDPAAFEL